MQLKCTTDRDEMWCGDSGELGKDIMVFTVVVSGDCDVSFGGDSDTPGAAATLESIGHVGAEENKIIGKEVSEFVQKELGIHPDRFFMSIYDIKGFNIVKGAITH
ncbi:macrophage migration inhibitory factor-like isoform X2 [Choristoneura fumiferana]|uniref:macrophage migration inhibitory factor-like isoform X2 n=1 Tax=Choristoneura fumiferana TaxID=7141 RepID=UPI003D1570EA